MTCALQNNIHYFKQTFFLIITNSTTLRLEQRINMFISTAVQYAEN